MASAPKPLAGIGLMCLAMAVLPFIDVIAKHLGQTGVPILLIVWARVAFGTVLTLPLALQQGGRRALWPDRPAYHTARAAFLLCATGLFFLSLSYMPIADALAIFFVQPLVLTTLSPLILGEHVGPRRWAAVVVGFVGMLIIIRPGFASLNPGVGFAFAAGVSLALYFLMTRRISGQAPAMVTTYHTNLMGAGLLTLALPLFWQTPDVATWVLFAALGLIATLGHLFIVMAYDHAEASLLAPLAYTEIVMATLLGWWFFGDLPDGWTVLGVSILIASASYIALREQALARGRKPQAAP